MTALSGDPPDYYKAWIIKTAEEPDCGFILIYCGFEPPVICTDCGFKNALFAGRTPDVCGSLQVPMLEQTPELQPMTLFEYLQAKYPGKYDKSKLRTLQKRVQQLDCDIGPIVA